MSEQDPRKVYIINQVRNIFQVKEVPRELLSDPTLDDFLNTVNVAGIRITKDESNQLRAEKIDPKSPGSGSGKGVQVCICKVRNEEIAPEEMREQIIFNTINETPLVTLLNNL
jgi:hypothetical protein